MADSFLAKAEDWVDGMSRTIKPYIIPIGRIFLMSTFIEDGIRMLLQFNDQWRYLSHETWLGSVGLTLPFIFINIVLQFVCCGLIIANQKILHAVIGLVAVVILQLIGYTTLYSVAFFLRSMSLCGSLLLVLAEANEGMGKTMAFGGLADERENRNKSYLQLAGRCLVVMMQLSVIHSGMSILRTVTTIIEVSLIVLVAVGYKTKLSAFILVTILLTSNFFINSFWLEPSRYRADVLKYDFFQTLSICGGLLYIVHLGGGDISIDRSKKDY